MRVHACIHICKLMARSLRSRENVFLILSASLSNFIALTHSRLSLERGVYIQLTSKYVKSRTIVKQKPKINKAQNLYKQESDETPSLSLSIVFHFKVTVQTQKNEGRLSVSETNPKQGLKNQG